MILLTVFSDFVLILLTVFSTACPKICWNHVRYNGIFNDKKHTRLLPFPCTDDENLITFAGTWRGPFSYVEFPMYNQIKLAAKTQSLCRSPQFSVMYYDVKSKNLRKQIRIYFFSVAVTHLHPVSSSFKKKKYFLTLPVSFA